MGLCTPERRMTYSLSRFSMNKLLSAGMFSLSFVSDR